MPSPTPLTVNCCRNEHFVSPQNTDMRFPGSLSPPDRKRAAWLDPSHRGGRCLQTQPQPACISPPASVSNPSPRSSTPLRAPVAQLDRALPSEGRGREFESRRVRQHFRVLKAISSKRRSGRGKHIASSMAKNSSIPDDRWGERPRDDLGGFRGVIR
jgi:hypothetical protein